MPGYLSHLALRVSAARPAVRPRIPSLFESLPNSGIAGEPEARGLRVVDQERIAPPPPPVALRPEPQAQLEAHPDLHDPPAPVRGSQPVRRRPPSRQAPAIVPEEVTIAAPRPAERTAEALSAEHRTDVSPQHLVIRPEVRSVQAAEDTRKAESHLPAPPLRDVEPPRAWHSAPLESHTVRAQPEKASTEPTRIVPEAAPVIPARAIQPAPVHAPQTEIRPAVRALAEAPPGLHEEPAIQVTIGRLIVEAVMPAPAAPPPAPRPRATGPRLSLDDYLSQRRSQA